MCIKWGDHQIDFRSPLWLREKILVPPLHWKNNPSHKKIMDEWVACACGWEKYDYIRTCHRVWTMLPQRHEKILTDVSKKELHRRWEKMRKNVIIYEHVTGHELWQREMLRWRREHFLNDVSKKWKRRPSPGKNMFIINIILCVSVIRGLMQIILWMQATFNWLLTWLLTWLLIL